MIFIVLLPQPSGCSIDILNCAYGDYTVKGYPGRMWLFNFAGMLRIKMKGEEKVPIFRYCLSEVDLQGKA